MSTFNLHSYIHLILDNFNLNLVSMSVLSYVSKVKLLLWNFCLFPNFIFQ